MKTARALLIIAINTICIYNNIDAQKLITVKGQEGLYYSTIDDLKKQQKPELDFYAFSPHDTIASVGAQSGNWEAAYAAVSDSLFFYLEDIDISYCNPQQAALAWQYYSTLKGQPLTSGYKVVTGTERATNLPANSCNKILITNSFHEFSQPAAMLADIAAKLKPGGILYIDEVIARYSGELHVGCKKPLYFETGLINILAKNGFTYKNSITLAVYKKQPSRKLFAFTRTGN